MLSPHFAFLSLLTPAIVSCPHTPQKLLDQAHDQPPICHPGPPYGSCQPPLFALGMHSLFQSSFNSQVTLVPAGGSGSHSTLQCRPPADLYPQPAPSHPALTLTHAMVTKTL